MIRRLFLIQNWQAPKRGWKTYPPVGNYYSKDKTLKASIQNISGGSALFILSLLYSAFATGINLKEYSYLSLRRRY
jgi:hypothetical protein